MSGLDRLYRLRQKGDGGAKSGSHAQVLCQFTHGDEGSGTVADLLADHYLQI